MRSIPRTRISNNEGDFLTIDERIEKGIKLPIQPQTFLKSDLYGNPIAGLLDNVERPSDIKMIENETEILSLLMKASGVSQHVVPSFYEGGDDVYIENKLRTDVTVTTGDRRAIHTISNYYNTLGIYRDDFDKTTNDKMARNAYYAICEKAMMDYMRSVQFKVQDNRTGDTIKEATDFFEVPNPQDDMGTIFASLIRDVTRYDAGVIVKTFNKGGHVVEIKPYLATEFWREQDRVPFIINVPIMNTVDLTGGAYASHQQPTYQGWWSHGYTERFWQRSRTGVYIPFQPEEISYFMMYPRTDGIYGTDFIKFLKYQIQYLIDSTKAAGKTFENGVVPSVVWEHPEVHTIQQLKQRIAELKYNNQGWQRFGSVIHTVAGEKVNSFAHTLVDMQWLEGQKFVAQLVWATWGFSPEEFMGGGENRASSYVKRNITKSRLLYPLMTFLEQRMNRDILPFLKGYRKYWRFSFVRDVDLDDEQKVATTNSIKASTFLQYYQSGFPIEASMELSGLDKNKYKFDIDMLEAEIMQNQLMMAGQQPGELTGGMEDTEAGRYGAGAPSYVDAGIGDTGQGAASFENDPRDPSIDEEQYKKADIKFNKDGVPLAKRKSEFERLNKFMRGETDAAPMPEYARDGYIAKKAKDDDRDKTIESNKQALGKMKGEEEESNKKVEDTVKTVGQLAAMALAKKPKKDDKDELEKSTTINPASVVTSLISGYVGGKIAGAMRESKKPKEDKPSPLRHKQTTETNKDINWNPQQKKKFKPISENVPEHASTGTKPQFQTTLHGNKRNTFSEEGVNQTPTLHTEWGVEKSLKLDKKDPRPDMDYDPYWLTQGIKVEMEHTEDPEIAKEIAKDHLDEFSMYYQSLKKMENGLRKARLPFQKVEMYQRGDIVKAKVYITHPSEAPKGRSVRRGNKGGYYYITNEQHKGQNKELPSGKKPEQKKKSGKGWGDTGGSDGQEEAPMMPPSPPSIEGAEAQVKIEGMGIGVVAAIVGGRLVVKKLNNGPTNQFIKIVEKKSGEQPNAEKIIECMLITAKEMGLEIYE